MKKLVPFLICAATFLTVFAVNLVAQDSTAVSGLPSFVLPGKVSVWLTAALAVYELVIRFVPTVKSFSLLTWAIRLIRFLVPDKNVKGPDHG